MELYINVVFTLFWNVKLIHNGILIEWVKNRNIHTYVHLLIGHPQRVT